MIDIFNEFCNILYNRKKMFEEMCSKVNELHANQGEADTQLKNLLLKEIDLRKQDQLKIAQLEKTVMDLKTEMSTAFAGSHAKLDQVHRSLRSHEENVLAEMSKRLIELQNNICGSTLNVTERGSNRQNSKRVAAPDDINVVEPKVVRPNVHFGMSRPGTFELTRTTTETPSRSYVSNRPETNEAQTTNIISTSSFKTAVPKSCYVNWDNKSSILKNAKFVQFQELRAILEEISKKPTCIEDDGNVSVLLSTEEINATRQKIRALHKLSVNKYKRFPSTGNYINVNLNSKNNTELKKILFENGVYNFYEAAYSYLALIQNNTIDQGQFERSYSLKWSPDTINLDARW